MKRLILIMGIITSVVLNFAVFLRITETAYAAIAPGCYVTDSNGNNASKIDCSTFKYATNSNFAPDPNGCYAMTGPGPVFRTFRQVNCTTGAAISTNIPTAPTPSNPAPAPSSKPPIPLGCPGSTLQGPASPDNLKVCAQIPLGCPGSTQQGPVANVDLSKCPYEAGGTGTTPGGAPSNPTPAPGGGSTGGGSSGGGSSGSGTSNGQTKPAGPDDKAIEAAKAKISAERDKSLHCSGPQDCISKNPLIKRLGLVFDLLSAVVAMAIIGTVIVGGIRYSASAGDPNAVTKAKKMIMNALLAFVGYLFLYAFLQWLVPGGLF